MKVNDGTFPVCELKQLIATTCLDLSEVTAYGLALVLGDLLLARDEQGDVGEIVFIAPGWDGPPPNVPPEELELIVRTDRSHVTSLRASMVELKELLSPLLRAS